MASRVAETTRLLRAVSNGEAQAADDLLPHVYDELRQIAQRVMRAERRSHTLQPTELIHEAYLRLVDADGDWDGRLHFTRVAARAMRFVLVDHARHKLRRKRAGSRQKVTFDEQLDGIADDADLVLCVHDGLEQLSKIDPQLGQIVELRFFGGLTLDETADSLDVSRPTVVRGWRTARAWWVSEFGDGETGGPGETGRTDGE